MELITDTNEIIPEKPSKPNTLSFKGEGGELLGIMLFNWILTSFTLGLYYPWARVNKLKFLYGKTHLNNIPFIFHGTGKELFKGFLKFFGFIVLWYVLFIYVTIQKDQAAMVVRILLPIFSLLFILIIPL